MIIKTLHVIFNTDRVLRWRLILEEYVLDTEYMQGDKNIVAGAFSKVPVNGNQDNTQDYTYKSKFC